MIDLNFFRDFTPNWNYSYADDYIFINMFLQDSSSFYRDDNQINAQLPFSVRFLSKYYFSILGETYEVKNSNIYTHVLSDEIDFFLTLNTKSFKTKYTIINYDNATLVTASLGMILKYYGKFRKSFKKSYRANILLIRFVKSTIIKLIRKKNYIFIVEGFNSKFFTLINLLNFMKTDTNLCYYLLKPKLEFGGRIFRKIKSIKRKLQKKNIKNIKNYKSFLKKFSKINYQV